MFTKLGMQNFKPWKGAHAIELKPLTLLLGVNSAGKTSLLQPLLLLRQTAESPDRQQALNLGGQQGAILNLGTMEDVLSGHDTTGHLSFSLTFDLPHAEADDASSMAACSGPAPEARYEVEYSCQDQVTPCVQRMRYDADGKVFEVIRQKGGTYALTAPGFQAAGLGAMPLGSGPLGGSTGVKRGFEPERSIAFSADAVLAMGQAGPLAQDLALALTRRLQNVAYLGPLRVRPERYYAWSGATPGELDTKGALAIPALLASANGRGPEGLLDNVSTWLTRMEVADGLRLEQQGHSNIYEVRVRRGGQDANLVDVGFGISQVLPIITLAFFAPEGSTVIMEQPELHLHPLAQLHLANLLVEIAQERKIQFLVETHSEHMFRRLQFLIAEQTTSADQCALYFVDHGEDGFAKLEPLVVDAYGRVANWPSKFFGDAVGEAERQMRATLLRKKGEQKSA